MVDGKPQFVDLTGNLIPVVDPNVSAVSVPFHPFQANQLPMDVIVRNIADPATGILAFTKYPKSSVDERPPTPVCLLRATLPDSVWTPTLRKGRQQGAAGDVEYVPPDDDKPKKLEWPGSDEPAENALPVDTAYALKDMEKKPELKPPPTKRLVEGDVQSRREVTEEQQALDDGSTIKRQIATVTSFRPITEYPSREDDFKEPTVVDEKVVSVDIEENSVHLPPGVVEPYGSNVVAKVNTEKFEDVLPDGVPRSRTVTTLAVKLKPSSDEMVPVGIEPEYEKRPLQQQPPKSALERMEDLLKSNEDDILPSIDEAHVGKSPVVLVEGGRGIPRISRRFGAVSPKTEVSEDEQTLNDGTTVKWKTTTTKYAAPVFEVSELDGRSSERLIGEQLIQTDIQEVVMKMAPGILYPYGNDIESESTEEHFEDTLPDGSKVKKNVVNIDVRNVKPDTMDTPEDALVDAYGMPLDADGKKYSKPGTIGTSEAAPKDAYGRPLDTGSKRYPKPDAIGRPEGAPVDAYGTPLDAGGRRYPKPGTVGTSDAAPRDAYGVPLDTGSRRYPPDHQAQTIPGEHVQQPKGVVPGEKPVISSAGPAVAREGGNIPSDAIPRKTTKEYRRGLNNGDVLIKKITTTQHLQPTVGDKGADKVPSPKVVGTEIEENVLKLPCGCIEAGGNNVQCDINVDKTDEQTPDGAPVSKKTVTANVRLKTPKSRIVKGDTQSRLKTLEDRHNLDEGTLVAEKTTETDYFKPVVEIRCVDGKEVRLPLTEEPVKVESLRNVLELHPGVIEPYGSNVTTDVTVDNFDEKLPNGVPVKRKVVKLVVTPINEDAGPTDGEAQQQPTDLEGQTPGKLKAVPLAGDIASKTPESDTGIPVSQSQRPGEPVVGDVRGRPTVTDGLTPSAQKKIIEGPIKSKTDVTEDERPLPSGKTLKHKATTVTHIKPIEEVTIINGRPAGSTFREEVVDKEIEDSYTELPAGVKSPYGPDVESETTVDRLDDEVIDGVPVKRTVRRTKVHRKPISTTPALRDLLHEIENTVADTETAAVNKINELLSPTETTLEGVADDGKPADKVPVKDKPLPDGEVRSRTSVLEFSRCLEDGTMIRRIVAVTQHYVPVQEPAAATRPAGPSSVRRGERLIDVEIDENLIALPPGVAEPNGDNCDTTIAVQKSERTLADGTPVRKTAATTVVTLKPPKTRLVEGDVEHRTNVEQDQKCLPDGSTIRRKIITTRKIRPVSEVTVTDGKEIIKFLREKVVGATIEENILELPPGVIEPSGANCDTDITVSEVDDALTDGTPAKRKIVRMVVRIKDQTKPEKPPSDDKRPTEPEKTAAVDGPVRSESETKQYEESLEDGTTIVRKVITTKHIKAVTEPQSPGRGGPADSVTRDKVVGVDIEENILQLPPGVIEPFAKNCDNDISVDHSEQTSVEGVVVSRKVVKMTVRLKQREEVKPAPTTKTVEGDVVERVDVKESEKMLDDGTKSMTKRVTKKRVRPVTDVTIVDGVPTVTNYREVTLDATIDETVQELGPGVTEPRETDKVKATTNVERTHELLPDGTKAAKTVTTTSYRRPPEPQKLIEPAPTTKTVEGDLVERVDVKESEKTLDDGTKSMTKRVTKKRVRPVTDVTIVDGVPTVTNYREVTLDAAIDETVQELGPGVTEPRETDKVKATTNVERTHELLPDGTKAAKTVTTTSYRRTAEPQKLIEPAPTTKTVEGDVVERVDVKESEKMLDDGTKSMTKRVTKKRVRPVTDVTIVDGVPTVTNYREVTLDATIDETVQELGPGVTEPRETDKVKATTNVERTHELLPDGTKAAKTVTTTSYRRTAEPKVTQKFIDGPVEARTHVDEDSKKLDDGTVIKRRVETTKFIKPVRVITRTDGVVTDSKVQEEVVSTEVNERVTEMLPGVVEPFGDDVQTSTSEQNFQETLPDGSPLKKKVVKVTASLRPRVYEKEERVRRIGLDGAMIEDAGSPGSSRRSSVSDDGTLMSPTDGPSPVGSELDLRTFGVYADVVETEPQVEKDVQEYEETLPDSTVVRKRIVTTVEKKTVLMRALMPEDEAGAAEPLVQRYVDVTEEEPQVVTDVYDTAETMPDGELAKKRVKTTGQRRLTTERKLVTGHLQDEQLQSPERQSGLNSSTLLLSYRPHSFWLIKRKLI